MQRVNVYEGETKSYASDIIGALLQRASLPLIYDLMVYIM